MTSKHLLARIRDTLSGQPPFDDRCSAAGVFWAALALYVFVLPIGGTIALRNLAMAAMLVAMGWALAARRQWPSIALWQPWLVYACVALASLTYALAPGYSLSEIKAEVLFPWLIFGLAANSITGEASYRRFIGLICVGNGFLVAFSLATAATGGTTKDNLIGTLNTGVGTYSTYLITCAPFIFALAVDAARRRNRALALALTVLLVADLISLLVTQNRQAFVALLVELAVGSVWVLRRRPSRRLLVTIGLALLVVGALFVKQFQARDQLAQQGELGQAVQADVRWPLWRFAVAGIADKPWTGGGFGIRAFKLRYPDYEPNSMLWHAHNMVLNKGVQMGVPGIAAFLLLFLSVPLGLAKGLRGPPWIRDLAIAGIAMGAGVFLKNMTDDFFSRDSGYLFWLFAGAAFGVIRSAASTEITQ